MNKRCQQLFIGGSWQPALAGKTREIINPYNREVIARVAEGGREDGAAALAAAREAFDGGDWSGLPASERATFLFRLADRIETEREELAALESLDTGKTVAESRWDMDDIAGIFRYYGGLADKDGGEVIDPPLADCSSRVVREPVGVCSQISPWNYPLLQASWKLAPALAAGCTVVVKPSEITPLTTLRITEIIEEIGIPRGVVNTVLGPGATVGAEMAESSLADMVSFTGGIETGKIIMRAASGNVKRVALELGGKNPNIVFDDADLDTAVDYALNAVFFHAGQICSAGSRLLLHDSIHDHFVDQLKKRMASITLGNGFEEDTRMGPLISSEHLAKVENHVSAAIAEGAKLELGGSRPEDTDLQEGFFYLPTLFTGCHGGMQIVREEVFGPVITVERFHGEEEAVQLANGTIYGLAAGFWTKDCDRMHRLSQKLRFGTVWINDFNVYFTQAPWGGFKQSGIGRELGRQGLEEYTEVKHIFQNHNTKPLGWFGV